jgi:hypothetical protein
MKFNLPKGVSDLFKTAAAKLDPTATSFVPETPTGQHDRALPETTNPNFAIYNNGVPALTPQNLKEVLAGIGDDALDENFGPDAAEAAELEDVDRFVKEMAMIDLLEDREVRKVFFVDRFIS